MRKILLRLAVATALLVGALSLNTVSVRAGYGGWCAGTFSESMQCEMAYDYCTVILPGEWQSGSCVEEGVFSYSCWVGLPGPDPWWTVCHCQAWFCE